MSEISDLEARLDQAMTGLLPQLRTTKILDTSSMLELLEVAKGFETLLKDAAVVPRELVGKLWWVFTEMITQAGYASSPEAILEAAWTYEEHLNTIFGPNFK